MAKTTKWNWRSSDAKRILVEDITNGIISLNDSMSASEVYVKYKDRPEFQDVPYDKPSFAKRLKDLQAQISQEKEKSITDADALAHDRKIHPRPALNHRGEPQWVDSAAAQRLRLDVHDKKHKDMPPQDLHQSRPEYQIYSLDVFRGHIYQEERRRKYIAQRFGTGSP